MHKYRALLRHDMHNAWRDPMILLIVLGPLLLILAIRYGLPPFSAWLASFSSIDLLSYSSLISAFLMLLIPQLIGIGAGLMMLDERDERLIDCYAVTPLRKKGYIAYRLTLPVVIACVMSALFLLASGVTRQQPENGAVLLLLVLEAPLISLFLVTLAANKVEGLALSKMIGLLLLGAVSAYFVPLPWQYLAGILPTYWPSKLYLDGSALGGKPYLAWAVFGIGLTWHLILLQLLLRRLWSRLE